MNDPFISLADLHARLVNQGHRLVGDPSQSTDIVPHPEQIVTVALNLDPVLKAEYRGNYFACLVDDNHRPYISDHPAFAFPEAFSRLAVEEPPVGGFMNGPFRWLLRRLTALPSVLLWPDSRSRPAGEGGFIEATRLNEMPRLKQSVSTAPLSAGALILNLESQPDRALLWEVAQRAGDAYLDPFVSDLGCVEVYQLHHHDKVVASIPDGERRRALLRELSALGDVLEDCSGYAVPSDEEDWD
jgi:hypothetical protein